jgi:tRNA pseudouridine32 synthase/23S rRNA pseudouridine746 synthase
LQRPIVGDPLYGTPADRLHLHALCIEFPHPVTGNFIRLEADLE